MTTLIDQLLVEQATLTAVERFSALHDRGSVKERYSALLPARGPAAGEQYAFEVNLDACTGCKACVVACHSLNGLDDDEAFRDVGIIIGEAYQQTVTTACHHCADPACANGCPVKAYEKDAVTGIVKHLDDQCIGCQYCMLKCPYEVPKYHVRLGIVRKCDMCAQRLGVGEAPACVQACPNEAIKITLRRTDGVTGQMLPGTFDSSYTQPTTTYTTQRAMPADATAADVQVLRVQHTHWPLVGMLLLTQLAAGWLCMGLLVPGCVALFAGLSVSVLHLGRPLGAWRFFLGLKTSWMSREILAFSVVAGVASGLLGWSMFMGSVPLWTTMAVGVLAMIAVFTSAMIYIDTRRAWWSAGRSLVSFFGAAVLMGTSLFYPLFAMCAGVAFFVAELKLKRLCVMSLRLEREKLLGWSMLQSSAMALAMSLQLMHAPTAFACWCIGFVAERVIFFKAVDSPKMPGGVTR